MTNDALDTVAQALRQAEASGKAIAPIRDSIGEDNAEAAPPTSIWSSPAPGTAC